MAPQPPYWDAMPLLAATMMTTMPTTQAERALRGWQ
jgi:hypothetical protein